MRMHSQPLVLKFLLRDQRQMLQSIKRVCPSLMCWRKYLKNNILTMKIGGYLRKSSLCRLRCARLEGTEGLCINHWGSLPQIIERYFSNISLQEAAKKLEEVHEKSCEFRGGISLYRKLQHLAQYEQGSGRSTKLILNLSSSAWLWTSLCHVHF